MSDKRGVGRMSERGAGRMSYVACDLSCMKNE